MAESSGSHRGLESRSLRSLCLVVACLLLAGASHGQDAAVSDKPALYSLPWLLRPAVPGTVVRLDETVASFEDPASGTSGITYVTTLITSYKVSDNLALILRGAWVKNSAPEGGPDPRGKAWSNGVIGANYSRTFGTCWRWTGFLGSNIPWGSGGGDSPKPGDAAALLAGNAARSQMEGSLFAVNYWTVIAGGDLTYVSPAVSLQFEATFFQLTHVRGPDTEDSSRTNFTGGVHAGHFFSRAFSLGAEFRIQRWLSTPAPVRADPAARQQLTFGIGPRFHFKIGKSWFRPGVSYSLALDDPMARKGYDIVQLDLPIAF